MRPVLTEQTAKEYKVMVVLGVALLVFALPISCVVGIGSTSDMPMLVSGVVLFLGTILILAGAIGGWWHHG